MTRLVGEHEEKLARRDQAQLTACNLFYCAGIISQAPSRTAEVCIVSPETTDIVDEHAMSASCLHRVDEAVFTNKCVRDENRGTEEERKLDRSMCARRRRRATVGKTRVCPCSVAGHEYSTTFGMRGRNE